VFKLGKRSIERLQGVHPDLVRVVERAIDLTPVDFTVLEGLRSPERQQTLVASGASQTLNSRHITGHAVDLGAWVDNQVDWSWPLYHKIANAMKAAANELGVAIVWGGDWKTFKDGPHFELDRKYYP
jgi:peptidoglycan L-alanyl-D-glutamate endopeptidase CwlK